MKVLIQWTLADPTDWIEVDLRDTPQLRRAWERLAKKAEPVGGEIIDDTPGWVFGLNIQGVEFGGDDHYAAELLTSDPRGFGLRITCWNDDPTDWPVGTRHAKVWEFFDPAPDSNLGGAANTRQYLTVYDERDPSPYSGRSTTGGPVVILPWAQFVTPSATLTRHGIWVSDALFDQHVAIRRRHSWREWIV